MDHSTLQAPKSGRSRFSKALPAPPPGLEHDRPQAPSRDLPALPYSSFPPRKESITIRTSSSISTSVRSNLAASPLPAPPSDSKMEAAHLQTQTKLIPRKPVGLPTTPAPEGATKSKKMKRMSSISSLLSAYSNSSTDSVQRSSQGSIFTKDSEPSNSPDREGINDAQQPLPNILPYIPSGPYEDEKLQTTDKTRADDLPPPPPLKKLTRPSTPPSDRPRGTSPISRPGPSDEGPAGSSPTLANGSPQRQEIWRRRASSKTDGNILIPELKLEASLGSTTSTSQEPTNADLLPPPSLAQNSNSTTTLPPRSASLPGRNVRPTRQIEPQDQDEMRKLKTKLKELTHRGEDRNDSEGPKDASIEVKTSQPPRDYAPKAVPEPKPEIKADISLAPPTKVQPTTEGTSTIAPKMALEAVLSPSSVTSSESAGKPISRRPVGGPARDQPEMHKKVSSSDLRRPGPGLPNHPRPSPSISSLRSPMASQPIQEAARTRVVPQPSPPAAMPVSPSDLNEPPQKPELYKLVSALNEPVISPDPTGNRKPTRKISRDVDASMLSDINEFTENVTDEHAKKVNEALARFPRNAEQPAPPVDVVWKAKPLTINHYECFARHTTWLPVKNTNYPLTCQTCGVEDKNWRRACAFCSLRICVPCHDRLMGTYNSNLRALMDDIESTRA
ncbi:hypothetical protein AAE478_003798 [Parahypoxylon ruwenzoriense]